MLQYHLFRKCLCRCVSDSRSNGDLHAQLLQAAEVVPYETVFLIGSSAGRVLGIGLSRLEHLINGDKHRMSHCDDGRPSAGSWR